MSTAYPLPAQRTVTGYEPKLERFVVQFLPRPPDVLPLTDWELKLHLARFRRLHGIATEGGISPMKIEIVLGALLIAACFAVGCTVTWKYVQMHCDTEHELDLDGRVYFCVRADRVPAP